MQKNGKTNQLKSSMLLTPGISRPFIVLSEIYGLRSSCINPFHSKNGFRLFTKLEDIHDSWREYFNEFLNRPSNVDYSFRDQLDHLLIKDELDNQPTIYEVSKAFAQTNGGKALEQDRINAELLKCGGYRLNEMQHKVFYAWTEGLPLDWRDVLLFPLFKKGS